MGRTIVDTCPSLSPSGESSKIQRHGFGLHAHGDLGVALSCADVDVAEPASDEVDFGTGLEQVNGGRVAPHLRRDAARVTGGALKAVRIIAAIIYAVLGLLTLTEYSRLGV